MKIPKTIIRPVVTAGALEQTARDLVVIQALTPRPRARPRQAMQGGPCPWPTSRRHSAAAERSASRNTSPPPPHFLLLRLRRRLLLSGNLSGELRGGYELSPCPIRAWTPPEPAADGRTRRPSGERPMRSTTSATAATEAAACCKRSLRAAAAPNQQSLCRLTVYLSQYPSALPDSPLSVASTPRARPERVARGRARRRAGPRRLLPRGQRPRCCQFHRGDLPRGVGSAGPRGVLCAIVLALRPPPKHDQDHLH